MHHFLRSSSVILSCAIAMCAMPINAFAESNCTLLEIGENGTYKKVYTIAESEISEEGWYTRDNGETFSYYFEDGTFASGVSVLSDGYTYIFTDEGILKTGWQMADGKRYYYDPNNGQICIGWVSYMNNTYYVDSEKGKLTGCEKIDGKTYEFDGFGSLIGEVKTGISYDVPYYAQADPRWGNVYIGSKTIAQVGCLTSSMAMMHSYYTGTEITPDVMCKQYLTYSNNSLLWAEVYNLGYQVISISGNSNSYNLQSLYDHLQLGPVIVGATNSYGGMHYVVVTGCTKSSNENLTAADFTINDPGFTNKKTLDEHFRDYGNWLQFYCK